LAFLSFVLSFFVSVGAPAWRMNLMHGVATFLYGHIAAQALLHSLQQAMSHFVLSAAATVSRYPSKAAWC
jgi:hypothetical protein